jgi:hypothetical protein
MVNKEAENAMVAFPLLLASVRSVSLVMLCVTRQSSSTWQTRQDSSAAASTAGTMKSIMISIASKDNDRANAAVNFLELWGGDHPDCVFVILIVVVVIVVVVCVFGFLSSVFVKMEMDGKSHGTMWKYRLGHCMQNESRPKDTAC